MTTQLTTAQMEPTPSIQAAVNHCRITTAPAEAATFVTVSLCFPIVNVLKVLNGGKHPKQGLWAQSFPYSRL